MIHYTVVWSREIQEDLADIWLDAPDRAAITAAANLIDVELARDAQQKGVEVGEGLRALFVPPLRVLFTVHEQDRLVEVLRVRRL